MSFFFTFKDIYSHTCKKICTRVKKYAHAQKNLHAQKIMYAQKNKHAQKIRVHKNNWHFVVTLRHCCGTLKILGLKIFGV